MKIGTMITPTNAKIPSRSKTARRKRHGSRRNLLKAAGASLVALAAPRIGRAERANKLVFAPTSDLNLLDPVVTAFRPTRNHAYLVFDTLYGIDTNWTAQPQMVEGHQVEEDGLT
jgi:peptide/nickel transport system substrate-binding protein